MEHARRGEVDEHAGDAGREHPAARDARRVGQPPTPSQTIQAPRTTRTRAFASAASTSARRQPKLRSGVAGRWASHAAKSASPSASASESMCAASASSASDPETSPAAASTPANPSTSTRAVASARFSPPCACTTATLGAASVYDRRVAGVTFQGVCEDLPGRNARGQRPQPGDPGRRVPRPRRPLGLRQDDGAPDGRGARGHLRGRSSGSATGSSTTSRRATATSRWSSRATRSTRT